jgi:hypothetical protein
MNLPEAAEGLKLIGEKLSNRERSPDESSSFETLC